MRWTDAPQRALCCLALALLPATAFAQALTARLLDSTGQPVAHARVTVVGRAGSVTTDDAGRFVLNPGPLAPFELAVFDSTGEWLGLLRVEKLGHDGVPDLYLPPSERVEVRVQGGVAPSTLAPPGDATTVVSRGDVEQRMPERLAGVLRGIPGADHVGSGQATVPSLRGLAHGRTLLLLDGGRVTSERRVGPSASYLDPFVIENVDIVRGPGSVAYGSDALGGIIHVTTPSPAPDGLRGRFELSGGTGTDLLGAGVQANVPVGGGGLLVMAHARDFDDYDSPRGRVLDSGARDRGWLVKGLVPGHRVRWLLGLQVDAARDVGKPRVDPTGARTSYPREDSARFTASAELSPPRGFSSLRLQAFAGKYRLVTDRDEMQGGVLVRSRSDVEAYDASLRLVAERPAGGGLLRMGLDSHGRFGLSADNLRYELDDQGNVIASESETAIESARLLDTAVFVEGERTFPTLRASLGAGVRGTLATTDNRGGVFGDRSTSETTLSGYLAGSFRPASAWTATVQVARGFREPFLSDRYFSGVTGRGFITGNPDLRPETSRQLDLALQRIGPLSRLGVYAYLYRIEDLVERFRQADGSFAFRNRGEEEVRGLEVESDFDLGRNLSARMTLGWARGEILDDGTPAADVPPLGGSVSVHHRVGERWWWRAAYALFARDERPSETEAIIPSYGVLDATVGLRLPAALEARLVLGNLLDKVYPASADDDAVLAPGRSATLVLAGTF